jgi:hypothetical protein
MVLSDRYGGKPRPSIVKRTLLHIAVFGVGALLISALLGFVTTSIAESVLPSAGTSTRSKKAGASKSGKGSSKARRGRANEGAISP